MHQESVCPFWQKAESCPKPLKMHGFRPVLLRPGLLCIVVLLCCCVVVLLCCCARLRGPRSWGYVLSSALLLSVESHRTQQRMAHSPVLRGVQRKLLHSCCQSRPLVAIRPETRGANLAFPHHPEWRRARGNIRIRQVRCDVAVVFRRSGVP